MRFTIKSKLACAFGAIIVLSMFTGGVACMKLGQLSDISANHGGQSRPHGQGEPTGDHGSRPGSL